MPLSSGQKSNTNKKSSSCLLLLVSSTVKMETICSSETSDPLTTTRHYTPEDRTVHSYRVSLKIVTQTGLAKLCTEATRDINKCVTEQVSSNGICTGAATSEKKRNFDKNASMSRINGSQLNKFAYKTEISVANLVWVSQGTYLVRHHPSPPHNAAASTAPLLLISPYAPDTGQA
jgi:hypothetical protein